ncbi:hypothetical protein ACHAXS_008286 [Conticribra weissflogii]
MAMIEPATKHFHKQSINVTTMSSSSSTAQKEARFLASRAERLAKNATARTGTTRATSTTRRLHPNHPSSSSSSSEESDNDGGKLVEQIEIPNADPNGATEDAIPTSVSSTPKSNGGHLDNFEFHPSKTSVKEETRRFWNDFRTVCFHFRCRLDELLLLVRNPSSADGDGDGNIAEDSACCLSIVDEGRLDDKEIQIRKIRAYYATAAKRKEGRLRLDELLGEVRMLRGHCLNASSSMSSSSTSFWRRRRDDGDSERGASQRNDEDQPVEKYKSASDDGEIDSDFDSNVRAISKTEDCSDKDNHGTNHNNGGNGNATSHETGKNTDDKRKSNIQEKNLLHSLLRNPMPEITTTELRLISRDLETILNAIDEAREWISPKEKFVFRRYRLAMEEKAMQTLNTAVEQLVEENGASDVRDNEKDTTSSQDHSEYLKSKYGGIIDNIADCTVEVLPDGTLRINETSEEELRKYSLPRPYNMATACPTDMSSVSGSQEGSAIIPPPKVALQTAAIADNAVDNVNKNMSMSETTATSSNPIHNQFASTSSSTSSSSSYLIQNLSNTTLILHLPHLVSLHLHNISHCCIYVTQPTLGPVHVTKCHSSHVQCSCYQLRVHESTNVRFCVWTRSGPIIEDCSQMVFDGGYYGDLCDTNGNSSRNLTKYAESPGKNMYWDVKDFNWLRTLKKSPNFEVIAGDRERGGHESTPTIDKGRVAPLGNSNSGRVESVTHAEGENQVPGTDHEGSNDVEDFPPLDEEDSEDEL